MVGFGGSCFQKHIFNLVHIASAPRTPVQEFFMLVQNYILNLVHMCECQGAPTRTPISATFFWASGLRCV